ncbi:MAG TPA: hypothetical protein DD727_08685, partial [Clostridiales bacterium]|nr:hypothetical protein [Clostridiales bacterium]
MKKALWIANAFLIILFILLAGYYFLIPSDARVVPDGAGESRTIIGGIWEEAFPPPVIVNGEILLPYETVKKHIDPTLWWDESLKKVTITTKDRVIRMQTESLNALINGKPMDLDVPMQIREDTVYIPVGAFSDLYGIELKHLNRDGADTVMIDFRAREKVLTGPRTGIGVIRVHRSMSIRSPLIRKIRTDGESKPLTGEDELLVFGEENGWYRVRTQDGFFGYVQTGRVDLFPLPPLISPLPDPSVKEGPWAPAAGKINLT